MKWRPGEEEEEVLTHPEIGSSTTSCGHEIQPRRDGSCSSLWTGGLHHRLLPNIYRAPLLHCAPCAGGVSVPQLALGQTCRSSSPAPSSVRWDSGYGDGTAVPALRIDRCFPPAALGRLQHLLLGIANPLGSWRAPGTRMSCIPRAPCLPGSSGLSAWHCVAIPALHTLL